MSPSSRGFWPIFFDTLIKSWWWWWWWWSKCNTTVAKNFRSSKLITGVHSSLFTAHRVLPVFRSLIALSVLDLRASFRFGWGKFLRYPSLTVVIFHGVDNGLNTNSYNQRISVLHRSVRFRSSPPRSVLRGSSRVPAPLVGQERITNPKEQDIRPAKERLRGRLLPLRF